jgi:Domain of unknown function (DUF4118)
MAQNGLGPARSQVSPLPRTRSGLSPARRRGGLLLAAAGLPTLTAVLVTMRGTLALESVLLLYLLLVVAVALIGGIPPALLAAVGSFLLANWFLTPPYHTFVVEQRDQLIALAVFIVAATTVSITVELAARQRVTAERSRIEAEVLAKLTGTPVSDTSLTAVLDQVRTVFGMTSVALLECHGDNEQPVEIVGPPLHGAPTVRVDAARACAWSPKAPNCSAKTGGCSPASRPQPHAPGKTRSWPTRPPRAASWRRSTGCARAYSLLWATIYAHHSPVSRRPCPVCGRKTSPGRPKRSRSCSSPSRHPPTGSRI